MKDPRPIVALTDPNPGLPAYQAIRPGIARARQDTPKLRGRRPEIVDDRGKVRAQPSIVPADTKHNLADGHSYPETVPLRPIDPNGRPSAKPAVEVRGGGPYLGGAEDPTMSRLGRSGSEARLELVNYDRQARILKP